MTHLPTIGRTWKLWASRYKSGKLWHIGVRRWVELHGLPEPIVPVLVEEILGDRYAPEVTHYGWQYVEGSSYRHDDAPTMIQIRTGNDPADPRRALLFLNMCFPYGLDAAVKAGEGDVVAMRITERDDV
jgi:hypothetical protein